MSSLNPEQLREKAADLVRQLAQGCSAGGSIGSFSTVAYESSWVSLVQKKEANGEKKWRFPECFQYLLDTQDQNGGWTRSRCPSEVDAILNALAALLALKKHKEEPLNSQIPADLETRISRATTFLQSQLRNWDVESSDHVGFEVLVPTLLQLLESEGISFEEIPGLPALMSLNSKKLSKFNPDLVYGPIKLTLIHSLEALVGRINFDKVAHHKVDGSFMGSPAATAAYLIYSSKWDEEAEAFLAKVVANGSGKGSGGMPSAYPTPFFELTWVSTLYTLKHSR
jgi:aphidicolan-16beta-ol synthase/syn-copalyl-diphosphate synthase